MRLVSIQAFPNREIRFTTCHAPSSRNKSRESHYETDLTDAIASAPPCHSFKTLNGAKSFVKAGDSESQKPAGYGRLGRNSKFSTYGRRQMLRAGGALESVAPHTEALFVTLTHPGSTKESFRALAEWSAFAVQRLKAWICKKIKNNLSMYAWEYQKRGALHLHYVVHCPNKEKGEYIRENLKEEWNRILASISERSGVDLYKQSNRHSWKTNKDIVRVDAQWCNKSVAAYLSKYVSKTHLEKRFSNDRFFPPSRWYGVSRPLLQELAKQTITIKLPSLSLMRSQEYYEEVLSVLQSYSLKCYEYKHKVGIGRTIVAYCDKSQMESIWREIMIQTNSSQGSSSKSGMPLNNLLTAGICLMRRHSSWGETFSVISPPYVKRVMSSFSTSQLTTQLDREFLLETLQFCLCYTNKTRNQLPGECMRWLSLASSHLATLRETNTQVMPWIKQVKREEPDVDNHAF